jgi:hypothetical protein
MTHVTTAFIDGNPLSQDACLEIRVPETGYCQQINLATQGVFQLMEKPEEPLRGAATRLSELDEQINVAGRIGRITGDRAKHIEPSNIKLATGRQSSFLYIFEFHGAIIAHLRLPIKCKSNLNYSSRFSKEMNNSPCGPNQTRP